MKTDQGDVPLDPSWRSFGPWMCDCVILPVNGKTNHYSAYYKCENCFGYGLMPIPPTELR